MTLTLRIENYRSLEGGSPIEISSTGRSIRVGRANGNDWILPDTTRFISSHHFDVDFREGFWWLTDKSTNGTFLVGQPYRLDGPYRLQQGDRFQVGPYFMIVLLGAAPAAAQPFAGAGYGAAPVAPPPPVADYSDPWAVSGSAAAPVDPTPRHSARRSNDFGDEFIAAPSISAPPARPPPFGAPPAAPPSFGAPPAQSPGFGVPPISAPQAAPVGFGAPPPISAPPPAPVGVGVANGFGGAQLSLPPTPFQPAPPPPPAAPNPNWTAPPSPLNTGPSPGFAGTPAPAVQQHIGVPPAPPPAPMPLGMPVAPAAPPPAPMHAAPPGPADADAGRAFVRAFCEGAGLSADQAARISPNDFARELGSTLRVVSTEMMAMLQDRATTKRFTKGGDRTMIGAKNNNPLKFLPDAKQAMEVMFVTPRDGFMKAGESVTAGMADIRLHQMAVFAAIQPALIKLLSDLSPDSIDDGSSGGGLLGGGSNKKKAWDTFVERWDAKAGAHENGMLDVFLAHFAESYAAAVTAGRKDGKG